MIPFWISDEEKVIRLRNEHEFRLHEVNKFSSLLNTYAAEYGIFECIKKQNAMFRKLSRLDARYEFLVKKINKRIDTNIRRKNKMLIEKLKEKLREITEPNLKLNAIKAYLSKHLESFVEAMITTGASDAMRKIDETYRYNSNGYQFEISIKFEKDVGFKE